MTEDCFPHRSCVTSGPPTNPILNRSGEIPFERLPEADELHSCNFNILVFKRPGTNDLAETAERSLPTRIPRWRLIEPMRQYGQSPQGLILALIGSEEYRRCPC